MSRERSTTRPGSSAIRVCHDRRYRLTARYVNIEGEGGRGEGGRAEGLLAIENSARSRELKGSNEERKTGPGSTHSKYSITLNLVQIFRK